MSSTDSAAKTPEQENAETAVVENVKWSDSVIWSTFVVGLPIVLIKLLGKREFKWQDVTLDISLVWAVFLILTVAHLYVAILLVRSLRHYWFVSDAIGRRRLYDRITSTGGLLVRGLVARTKCIEDGCLYVQYDMSYLDPSAWGALLAFALMILAIVPFAYDRSFIRLLIAGFLIARLNWIIGSHWVIALSDLTTESKPDLDSDAAGTELASSAYFRKTEGAGIRLIGWDSEGYTFEPVNPIALPLWFVLNTLVFVSSFPFKVLLFGIFGVSRLWSKLGRHRR